MTAKDNCEEYLADVEALRLEAGGKTKQAPPFDIKPGDRYTDVNTHKIWELTDHGQWKEIHPASCPACGRKHGTGCGRDELVPRVGCYLLGGPPNSQKWVRAESREEQEFDRLGWKPIAQEMRDNSLWCMWEISVAEQTDLISDLRGMTQSNHVGRTAHRAAEEIERLTAALRMLLGK